jgi:DNA polymerase-3 subunit epsilon
MRQVVLDTETTGLETAQDHRIIEIGCVEIVNRRRTTRTFHRYVQPDRDIDSAAQEVHGITRERLAREPRFPEIARDLQAFLEGAELIIHNADFDVGFLNYEFERAGFGATRLAEVHKITDTLLLARRLHPGQRNTLDALCKRYNIDYSARERHSALLDAELLADVYLAMTGGQAALSLESAPLAGTDKHAMARLSREGLTLALVQATPEELQAHEEELRLIDKSCPEGALWRRLGA